MVLSPGSHLGPYRIDAVLGTGGMGEVYRALDTRLNRTVAIKILSSQFSSNSEFKQRFEREARAISSLSHPHICALYDIGHQNDADYLVMEFLEGETLADRLSKGALPLDKVLRYGMQIADALDKAHRKGIIHRDLKPGNIMITGSGVKLLDFGLAKSPPAGSETLLSGVSALPTAAKDLTAKGTILGTLQYMAPEQLEGRQTDPRTDIFALGIVLYEMATGKHAFTGQNQASLIAAILTAEPAPISSIQPMSSPAFDRVVRMCLSKDTEDRWQTAHDVGKELQWIAESGSQANIPIRVRTRRKTREWIAWSLTIVALLGIIGLAYYAFGLRQNRPHAESYRFHVPLPENSNLDWSAIGDPMAISPNGRHIVFAQTTKEYKTNLWIRSLDRLAWELLPGTDGAFGPFWSPDSRFIAFFTKGKLKKIGIDGGIPQTLCELDKEVEDGMASWGRSGAILFATRQGIAQVSATGGLPTNIVEWQLGTQFPGGWPQFLPDGRHFLYVIRSENQANVYLGSIDSKGKQNLGRTDSKVSYADPGYLLYMNDGVLLARPFDTKKLQFSDEPIPVARQVANLSHLTWAFFSVSQNGVLIYQSLSGFTRLVWYDRKGQEVGLVGSSAAYYSPRLSPDGKRLAVSVSSEVGRNEDLWIFDLSRNTNLRLTSDSGREIRPVWSSDGQQIVFEAGEGEGSLKVKEVNAPGSGQPLAPGFKGRARDWSPDARYILLDHFEANMAVDIWALPLFGERKPFPIVQTKFVDEMGRFSPDGRWIAYHSDESGIPQVYAISFPELGEKVLLSTSGGTMPRWRKDAKELFYVNLKDELVSVSVSQSGKRLDAGPENVLFKIKSMQSLGYDVTPDGQRFLINVPTGDSVDLPITAIVNWTKELSSPAGE